MGHPDGPIAQRPAQGKQGGGLEGPQGPLPVDPADELGPAWSNARVDISRQLTGSAGIEPSECGESREQGACASPSKASPTSSFTSGRTCRACSLSFPRMAAARLGKNVCADGMRARITCRSMPSGIVGSLSTR
jgi:hypothetical protein